MRRLLLLCVLAASAARADTLQLSPAGSAYGDAKGEPLRSPEGVACTAEGRVVVADSGNGRLLTWAFKDGALVAGAPIKFPELGVPVRLQIDSRGNVLSFDGKTRRIARVGEEGTFGGFLAPKGVPPATGFFPVSFKLDKVDNVYLLDVASSRVVVLDRDGAFIRQIAEPPGASFSDIAIDANGAVLAVDGPHAMVYADGVPLARAKEYASFPSYITVTGQGLIVLVDGHGHGLVVLAPDGTYLGRRLSIGWTEGLVYYPEQICIDAKGDTFVADRGNNRLQAFTQVK